MAKFVEGSTVASIFIGNPIVFQVSSAAIDSDKAVFHRVKMEVTVTGGGYETKYELSQPITGVASQTVEFDISSCMRAHADLYEYAPVTGNVSYPSFTASCSVKDVWVEDGQVRESQPVAKSFSASMGRFSDYELRRGHSTLTATRSRKPASGELVYPGDRIVYGTGSSSISAGSSVINVPADAAIYSSVSIPGIGQATVVPPDHRSRQFQFVNSRGCVESIRAFGLPSEKIVSEKKEHTISRFERINQFSRTMLRKFLRPADMTFSSGYVSYEWAQWWAYEFCMGQQHWMLTPDGTWLPVLVSINDNATIIDRSKVGLCYIEFTVKPDANGGLF